MILSTVLNFARAIAQTDSNGLKDAKGIIFANEALNDFHRRLVDAGVDASQTQEAYRQGVAGTGTYLYPSDMLFLKAIELNYANTIAQDYRTAEQVDVSNLATGSFSYLRVNARTDFPKFDDRGDQFEIFPTPTSAHNVTNLIRIFYYLKPTEYISVADTVAYPENLDATILGWRITSDYHYSVSNIDEGIAANAKYEERVKHYIETLARGAQQPIEATTLQITGFEF